MWGQCRKTIVSQWYHHVFLLVQDHCSSPTPSCIYWYIQEGAKLQNFLLLPLNYVSSTDCKSLYIQLLNTPISITMVLYVCGHVTCCKTFEFVPASITRSAIVFTSFTSTEQQLLTSLHTSHSILSEVVQCHSASSHVFLRII